MRRRKPACVAVYEAAQMGFKGIFNNITLFLLELTAIIALLPYISFSYALGARENHRASCLPHLLGAGPLSTLRGLQQYLQF